MYKCTSIRLVRKVKMHVKPFHGESRHEPNFSKDYQEHDSSEVPKGKACG